MKIIKAIDEFLFGSCCEYDSKSNRDIIRIRYIQSKNFECRSGELSPYVDSPPDVISDVGEATKLCYYFNGIPTEKGTFKFPSLPELSIEEPRVPSASQKFFYVDDEGGSEGEYERVRNENFDYLHEFPLPVTSLPKAKFMGVCLLAILNYAGTYLLEEYGVLPEVVVGAFKVYSVLFFAVPVVRGGGVWGGNFMRLMRNERRRKLFDEVMNS